ncbi:MAG TPA: preprotein translocase subunit SecG [Candidatus Methylomirabilis sp.]
MFIALAVLHVVIALGLILVVLLQSGKGADIGAAFGGGSSQTVFGGRGAATFLSKLTTILAVLFMVMSIVLTLHSSRMGTSSVIPEDRPSPATSTPAPAAQAPAAPAPQGQAPAAPPAPSK